MKYDAAQFSLTLSGKYKVAVVDKDGNEIWRQPDWKKNLILNCGMDHFALEQACTCMSFAIAGRGDRMNSITSSTSQASAINGVVYLDVGVGGIQDFNTTIVNGYTGSLQAGDMIKFADGTELMVSTSINGLDASLIDTTTVSTQSFTVWKTSQDGLQLEYRRAGSGIATSSFLSGYNGTEYIWQSASLFNYRTFDFGEEGVDVDYYEVGVGWAIKPRATETATFSRIRLDNVLTMSAQQRLRLVYGLTVNFMPTASVYTPNVPFAGWPVAPATNTNITSCIQVFNRWTAGTEISSGGTENPQYAPLQPSTAYNWGAGTCHIWLSADSSSLLPGPTGSLAPSYLDRKLSASYGAAIKAPCKSGSFTVVKYYTFGLNDSNSTRLMTMGLGTNYTSAPSIYYEPWYETQAFVCRFDEGQTKTDEQIVTLGFKWTWGRNLE